MSISAFSGPIVVFGQTITGSNPDIGPSLFWGGNGILDPRPQFGYTPGEAQGGITVGWSGDPIQSLYVVPVTKSATLITAAVHTVTSTAMTLASANATGLAVGVTVPRQDTGVNVTGLLEIDPLVISCTATITAGSNILTVTAMGAGSGYNLIGICPGMVLTDATHASAITTGTTITGFVSGGGGIGTYTMSTNAVTSYTGDTVTGLYTAFPHITPSTVGGSVQMWNPQAMCSRTLIITCNSSSGTGGVFTVNGLDVFGFPMTEQLTSAPGSALTVSGLKAWKYIKSITPNFTDATYTYSVGTTDAIGLPIRSDVYQTGATYDVSLMMNNAIIAATTGYTAAVKTTATATTGDVRGTYALQTSSNGTLVFAAAQAPLFPNINSSVGLYGVTQYTAW